MGGMLTSSRGARGGVRRESERSKPRKWFRRSLPEQRLLGHPEAFPGQMEYGFPPASSGSNLRSPPTWACLVNFHWVASRRHPEKKSKPPKLDSFDPVQRHPVEKHNFRILVSVISIFPSLPRAHDQRVAGGPVPAEIGREAECTLDKSPVYHQAKPEHQGETHAGVTTAPPCHPADSRD
ncbi:unnamed protein product [Pleuronectes platessa]|uniref:Uncharacterized protein n=1 Tax=Pleuronectes platessa TaxID=8262 RepID=A0A9N7Z8U6_PLEPL|nr:unnamed protein product [Pleuronectes platessa]